MEFLRKIYSKSHGRWQILHRCRIFEIAGVKIQNFEYMCQNKDIQRSSGKTTRTKQKLLETLNLAQTGKRIENFGNKIGFDKKHLFEINTVLAMIIDLISRKL